MLTNMESRLMIRVRSDRVEERAEVSHSAMHVDGEVSDYHYQNHAMVVISRSARFFGLRHWVLLLCLMLTRLTFVGVKKIPLVEYLRVVRTICCLNNTT